MSGEFLLLAFSALWMGILATISPCPMGTNVAAVSIIAAGGGKNPQNALLTATMYGIGRMLVHTLLGALIMKGFSSAPGMTALMGAIPSKLAGPVFIILGVVLSGWIEIPMPKKTAEWKKKILSGSPSSSIQTFFIGCIFALIPCPETAALFFGGMIPLAIEAKSIFLLPLLFGFGTALPVMLLGYLLSMGVGKFANSLGGIRKIEPLLRSVTCIAFVGVGFYLTLTHVYHVI